MKTIKKNGKTLGGEMMSKEEKETIMMKDQKI
jgi:hypothetical protein